LGKDDDVTAWSLLFVPASLALIVVLLMAVSWIEQRVLSPRALIVHTARSRGADPEAAEAFVAGQAETLLSGLTLRPAAGADAQLLEVAETS
jgi:hypothetical protein